MEEKQPSWLDDIFPAAQAQRDATKAKGLTIAQRYLVFSGPTADPRAAALLEQWTQAIRNARVPKNATATEYAAHNALREWVEGIHQQIAFAQANAQSIDWLKI